MKTVYLFPGQGAQAPGMAKDLWEASGKVKELFELASDIAKKDLAKLIFEGSEEDLKSTDNTQVAMTLANMSAATVLQEHGIMPGYVAGFSIGEYSALWAAGILSAADVFHLVLERGSAMEQNSRAYDQPEGNAGMTAVVGLTREQLVELFHRNNLKDVYIANHNSPTQVVLAGTFAGLNAAEAICNAADAMKVVRLKVSGPFHSPLLSTARTKFEAEINNYKWNDPNLPLISNVTAMPVRTGTEARALAGEQIVSAVRWVDTMTYLINEKVERILEVGPGKVLCGLWRAMTRDTKCQVAGTLDAIKELPQIS